MLKRENGNNDNDLPQTKVVKNVEQQLPSYSKGTESPKFDIFLTDKEITDRSQKEKLVVAQKVEGINMSSITPDHENKKMYEKAKNKKQMKQSLINDKSEREIEDLQYLRQWVKQLPKVPPTKHFGKFCFDADAIMAAMTTAR